ncbi:cellulase family glycosylhydrolase [Pedobacter sp. SYSU D00535]|uniref:cellulase family glycosylhydrolase n=1 Tax=Pedobacter sp. SYSU D00535 TaxID=2810308 RepID=UPI001A971C79|nr:cellulase family glycosylhydrolase [Pedobacter sp. SYSU D00535]
MRRIFSALMFVFVLLGWASSTFAQENAGIYVDNKGTIRWNGSNKEASFFGVNYTVPFAYGYRSHKLLGIDIKTAMKQDVYHMARLGLNAFRVHVWDTEITDSAGNLLQNEHLRLFDFLIAELKKRKIKILVTPIAFWGNGYPERDEKTPGFSAKYGKGPSVVKEEAIKAQENYMKQFFRHVNPYTKLSYRDDPDIIATEINNEPHHSGPKSGASDYINRLAAAIRSTGWTKPVFYNISESPFYADAVANANINGVSFQWYPSGLVANQTLKGNYLPYVDKYTIPFDTIPAFANKARMVYEFDAGDILQPVMYPAMARSFRTARFQWATQFAYDPMATAYANTEYQTHYLNLAYTPAKAISFLIASKAFHSVPLGKSYGSYPASNQFGNFRIDYKLGLSEMNAEQEFYYSNSTNSKPLSASKLKHVAGVGSSSLVQYSGSGAYFLDKLENGIWRLEVMPDAVQIRDPFEKASPQKEVTRIEWKNQTMKIALPDLGAIFELRPLNPNNRFSTTASNSQFTITPGTYLVVKKGKSGKDFSRSSSLGVLGLNEFVAPEPVSKEVFLRHEPYATVSSNQALQLKALVVGVGAESKVTLYINQLGGEYKTIEMEPGKNNEYRALLPAEFIKPGLLNYRIAVKSGDDYRVFPGNHKGDPWAWDNYQQETWKTFVAPAGGTLQLYNATEDQNIRLIPSWDRNISVSYTASDKPSQLLYSVYTTKPPAQNILGFQHFIGDKLEGRQADLSTFTHLLVKAKSTTGEPCKLKIALIDKDGQAYSFPLDLKNDLTEVRVPLASLVPDAALLLPRPYPGFHALLFQPSVANTMQLADLEKLEISVTGDKTASQNGKGLGFAIESVSLSK